MTIDNKVAMTVKSVVNNIQYIAVAVQCGKCDVKATACNHWSGNDCICEE